VIKRPVSSHNGAMKSYLVSSFAFAVSVASCACSDDSSSNDGTGAAGGAAGSDGGSGTAGSGGGAGSSGASAGLLEGVDGRAGSSSGGPAVTPVLPGDECAGEAIDGESIPLELLIMMDRSISMGDAESDYLLPGGGRKWDAVRQGFADFFELPQVQGLSAGIDFFSQDSCDPGVYATPQVEIGDVPSTAADILAAYDTWEPGGNTPIGPALEGALTYARQYKLDHLGVEVAVVLVTDGVPNGCGTSTADPQGGAALIAPIAEEYATGTPRIATYVLGIQGIEVSPDDFRHVVTTIAEAGGTSPVIVEATDNLADKFATGLEGIRAAAAPPCSYSVPLPPTGEALDLNRVNVVLEPEGSGPEPILNVPGADHCEYGGWYYDPPQNPEVIQLCQNTCEVVSTLTGSSFKVLFGCATVGQVE
jgi:hypothetical protein